MKNNNYAIALAGNPNVGKSTIFNTITGMNQHTGNWTGKTVEVCSGEYIKDKRIHKVIDLPGSYSIFAESEEEIVTKDFIESQNFDVLIVVVDANALERNLAFTLQILMKTQKVVLCLNMFESAKKNGYTIDTDELSLQLGVPVVTTDAIKGRGISTLMKSALGVADNTVKTFEVNGIKQLICISNEIKLIQNITDKCREICKLCVKNASENTTRNVFLDKLFTSKSTGIPIMVLFLLGLFWLTAYGANYPSELLSRTFSYLINSFSALLTDLCVPQLIISFICDGILKTGAWVVSVMLPPALIFFPMFALLEDFGYLPRVAFNLDGVFCKAGTSGKQALTMMMGFGCNACGVVGCRIIGTQNERKIAMLTNSFIPCNGRIPMLITLSSLLFLSSTNSNSFLVAIILLVVIILSVVVTLLTTKVLSLGLKSKNTSFIMELPSYKKPQIAKSIVFTIKNKVLSVLLRAIAVALPAGAIIWLLANIQIVGSSMLSYIIAFLNPFANLIGVDGTVLAAFLLGFPANEIVIPIMLMSYTAGSSLSDISSLSSISTLLVNNGWDGITVLCTLVLCIFHFPCSTTCITIYKESRSLRLMVLAMLIPLVIGVSLCFVINQAYHIFF